jgi:hypothetical protein
MEPTATSGVPLNVAAAYEATMARRAIGQQRAEGEAALRLIQAAALVTPQAQGASLPIDATISVRV